MIPATPITEEVRLPKYVQEEWSTILNKVAPNAVEGWKSILYMNYAIINRGDAFRQLLSVPLDNGVSRAWALVSEMPVSPLMRAFRRLISTGQQHDPTRTMGQALFPHQHLLHRPVPRQLRPCQVANAPCRQALHVPR